MIECVFIILIISLKQKMKTNVTYGESVKFQIGENT